MEIEVRTTPTLQDYLRFRRYAALRDATAWIAGALTLLPVFALLAFVLLPADALARAAAEDGIDVAAAESGRRRIIAILTVVTLMWLAQPLLSARRRRRRYAIDPWLHAPRTYRFSGDGMSVIRSDESVTVAWDQIARVRLPQDLLVLIGRDARTWIVPLRDVPSGVQPEVFRMIRQHVPRTHGF